jgi:hypothetical protein
MERTIIADRVRAAIFNLSDCEDAIAEERKLLELMPIAVVRGLLARRLLAECNLDLTLQSTLLKNEQEVTIGQIIDLLVYFMEKQEDEDAGIPPDIHDAA